MSSSSEEANVANFFASTMVETAKILLEFVNDSSDEETNSEPRTRRAALNRDREGAHERLVADYFAEDCVYPDELFKRRFRMSRRLFQRIANDLANYDEFFTLRYDARGKRGFTTLQKCTSAIRQLAYGTASDSWDEYLRMSARMSRECLYRFCEDVVNLYSKVYLRRPTKNEIQKLYAHHAERHGFPGMLGSIDCTHWPWRNCPTAWKGQFTRGDIGEPSIILESVCSQDLWIWHAFFGVAGSCNDLNVLAKSTVFDRIIRGTGPDDSFVLNGVEYKHGYYLADGIYPSYSSLVKTIQIPTDEKRKKFAKCQEGARKDVERLFGVLTAKWHVIGRPARAWHPENLRYIMYACTILHNMIIEDEGRAICEYDPNDVEENIEPVDEEQQQSNRWALEDSTVHNNLCTDLIDHIWNNFRVDDVGDE